MHADAEYRQNLSSQSEYDLSPPPADSDERDSESDARIEIQALPGPAIRALAELRARRAERFREMIDRLRGCGVQVASEGIDQSGQNTLGRRHLAELLVKARKAGSVREAFQRWLGDRGRIVVPKKRLPLAVAAGSGMP